MDELPALARSKDPGHRFRLYGCVLGSKDYMVPNDPTRRYDKNDYYNHPENYHCVFAEKVSPSGDQILSEFAIVCLIFFFLICLKHKVAPYASVIVNNTYWDKRFPRLLTTQQFRKMWKTPRGHRLIGVADISCDVNVSYLYLSITSYLCP
jgi:alpha-aminoadipic semialdehyde synthase